MKITKQQLQQIIKEEMEAELSEDKYATEDDRPLGTGRSLNCYTKKLVQPRLERRFRQQPEPMLRTSMLFCKKASLVGVPSPKVWEDLPLRQTWKDTKAIIVTRPESHLI